MINDDVAFAKTIRCFNATGNYLKKKKIEGRIVLASFDQQPPSRLFTGRHVLIAVVCLPSLSTAVKSGA